MILLKYYLRTRFKKANNALVEKVLETLEGKPLPVDDNYMYACLWEKSVQRAVNH